METPRRLPRTNRFKNKFASKRTEESPKGVTEIRFNPNPKRGSVAVPKGRLTRHMRWFLQQLKNEARKRDNQRAYLKRMECRHNAYVQRLHRGALTRFEKVLEQDDRKKHYLRSIGVDECSWRRDWGKKKNSKSRYSKRVKDRRPQKFKAKGGRRRGLDIDLDF